MYLLIYGHPNGPSLRLREYQTISEVQDRIHKERLIPSKDLKSMKPGEYVVLEVNQLAQG